MTAGIPAASASVRARSAPERKSAFAAISASTASEATTGDPQHVRVGGLAGLRVDQVVQLAVAAPPVAPVAARRCEPAVRELERQRVDADGPAAVADGDVAAGVHEAGPGRCEQLGRALGGVALADAAEVEADARLELDARAVERYFTAG